MGPRPGAARPTGPRTGGPHKPPLEPQGTTLWDYPSQHYGTGVQGDPRYIGATPSYVIWNLLQRYTRPGDMVIDPMCGSGTTLDVCRDTGRAGRGFDVAPFRPDIEAADARKLPVPSGSVDFVFLDPPYSTNINYSDDPRCIGKLDAFEEGYFDALDRVFAECHRVLANRRMMALYVCDVQQKRRGFAPIGVRLFALLMQYFQPVDHIAVVRHNRTLNDKRFARQALEDNSYLRGFNHLIVVKKHDAE